MREKLVLPPSGWLSQGEGLPKAGSDGGVWTFQGPRACPKRKGSERREAEQSQKREQRWHHPEVCLHPGSSARTGALRSDPGVQERRKR